VGATPSGEAFFFARNDHPDGSEFAGPTFSQDKQILFANIQEPGYVLAIQGPFTRQR
jgi:secreted PhoX family phosphatase